MEESDLKSIENLIGNVYQSIYGSHEESVEVIAKWIEAVQKSKMDPKFMVRLALDGKDYIRDY